MKSKDIMTLVAVAIFSAVVSMVLSNIFVNSEDSRNLTVEVVPEIYSEFNRPPDEYFNSSSINPTQTIQIGGENTTQPFGSQ